MSKALSGNPQRLSSRGSSLTPHQRVICQLILQGLQNKEISGSLGIPVNTVRAQTRSLLRRYGCKSRVELLSLK